MKYFKILIYILLPVTFSYILLNLNSSLVSLSIILMNFFNNLFPYLLFFLILNQVLIKTGIIYIFGYIIQTFLYPIFKINAKSSTLLLISLINGFPSSVLYTNIMINDKQIDNDCNKIAQNFFLPSAIFMFYVIKNNLDESYFSILVLSLYLPCFISLFISKNNDKYVDFNEIKHIIKENFNAFNPIKDLKEIFVNSISTIINILGMISFFSILTLLLHYPLLKGIFEFSMPSMEILKSSIPESIKTLLLLVILTFSSLSSIFQASLYLDTMNLTLSSFIKKRILLVSLSIIIFIVSQCFYYL